jgi:hypothetical protein
VESKARDKTQLQSLRVNIVELYDVRYIVEALSLPERLENIGRVLASTQVMASRPQVSRKFADAPEYFSPDKKISTARCSFVRR